MSERQSTIANDQDSYSILGVNPTASDIDIKIAYRRMVLQWHPDKQFHDREIAEQNLKKINDAYSKIKTPISRKNYNQVLKLQQRADNLSRFQKKRRIWTKFWTWLTMLESNKK